MKLHHLLTFLLSALAVASASVVPAPEENSVDDERSSNLRRALRQRIQDDYEAAVALDRAEDSALVEEDADEEKRRELEGRKKDRSGKVRS
jgi:hypothetical protein